MGVDKELRDAVNKLHQMGFSFHDEGVDDVTDVGGKDALGFCLSFAVAISVSNDARSRMRSVDGYVCMSKLGGGCGLGASTGWGSCWSSVGGGGVDG